ncbi:MAG: hypothetical protein R2744_01920 [Bacteroidales bacterium]
MSYALKTGMAKGYFNKKIKKRLIYAIFLLKTRGAITLLFTATSEESRSRKSGYHVVDQLVRRYAGSESVIDFAGSSIPDSGLY